TESTRIEVAWGTYRHFTNQLAAFEITCGLVPCRISLRHPVTARNRKIEKCVLLTPDHPCREFLIPRKDAALRRSPPCRLHDDGFALPALPADGAGKTCA